MPRRILLALASLALLTLSCAGQRPEPMPVMPMVAPPPPAPKPRLAAPTPPGLRLPDGAVPRRQAVQLRLVPTEEAFEGSTEIDLEVRSLSDAVWLHAAGLQIQNAELVARDGSGTAALTPFPSDEMVGLVPPQPIGPGRYTVRLGFSGKLPARESSGVYRQEENGDHYVFTQFEPVDARRAFPCFDEPSFKIPWQLTLEVPAGDAAFANTPQVSEQRTGDTKTVVFAETKPLPSYLVAFAVGPFEIVDAGKAGRAPTPIRIIVPRGKSAEAAYAAKTTGQILTRLEDYFDLPYPYEKLDHIAVPQKGGAMENPGLITFGTSTILGKPDERNIRLERGYAGIAAHEIGHIWFGDLVTMRWWDDLWLNEAFATWIAAKIVDEWQPTWDGKVARVQSRSGVMGGDALVSARRIRQPIDSKHDIANAFDGITYQKGAAIIGMFEGFVGAERFRDGERSYMRQHAHGNATAADFLGDVGKVVGQPQLFATAFPTFLDQAGFPLVTVSLRCDKGRPPRLSLSQQRYLPLGSPGGEKQLWQLPICARHPGGRSCALLTAAEGEVELAGAKSCPAWVLANADGAGYYRVLYEGDLLRRLLRDGGKALTVPERVGLLGDVGALVRTGRLPYGEALALVPTLAQDQNRHLVGGAAALAGGLSDNYVTDALRPNYRRFITKTFGARARRLGWLPKPGESDDLRLLRPALLSTVAETGEDQALLAEARRLGEAWIADRKSLAPELVGTVLSAAARAGDRALWDKLHAAAQIEKDRRERGRLLGAMAGFFDPAIVEENFKIALSDAFDPRESLTLVYGATGDPRTRPLAYDFVKRRYDEIIARMPRDFGAQLTGIGAGFCDVERRADVEAFFKERMSRATGGPRALAQVLERMDLCIALRFAHQAGVDAFLRKN